MTFLKWVLIAVAAYFLGNISTGLLVGRAVGHIDIRKTGSGNAGTTNIMRTLGWFPSVLTLLGDVLKAVIAVVIGRAVAGEIGAYVAGVAVLLGHNWPVLFGFKGGKGMASSLGIIIATEPLLALVLFVIQVIVLAATKYMSVASLCTAVLYPVLVAVLHHDNLAYVIFAIIAGALAIFCHRANIRRLLSHTENKLDFSKITALSKKKK